MALDSVHPKYVEHLEDWRQLRDAAKGERVVKSKGQTYLPPTSGMLIDGLGYKADGKPKLGQAAYDAYILRAVFPDYMGDALEYFMGALHNKSPVIELPEEMEGLRENCTPLGEPIEILLQRINLEQLTTGRVGILLDLPENPDPKNPMPFIALYVAEAIRNWDDSNSQLNREALNFVILDESSQVRDAEFNWSTSTKYRVLRLDGVYEAGAFVTTGGVPQFDETQMLTPKLRGQTLDKIPFQFINTKDISPEPDEPPLISLCRQCFTIYRGEADYRQNLFMQGQDTLVVIGARQSNALKGDASTEEPLRTGAGSRIDLDLQGDAKYVGVNSSGLSEQRTALSNDRARCEVKSGHLISVAKGDKESGSALRTRVGAQTATLNQIAKTAALALELLLKQCAVWMKADPKKVKVTPNLEFADYQMAGQDLMNLMNAKREGGAPISEESVHRLMVQGNLTNLDYQTEKSLIAKEEPFESPTMKLAKETAAMKAANPNSDPAPKDPSNPAPQTTQNN